MGQRLNRSFTKADRKRARGQRPPTPEYAESRKAWTSWGNPLAVVLYEREAISSATHAKIRVVELDIDGMDGRCRMRLSTLRPDELASIKEIFLEAFERAEPEAAKLFKANMERYRAGEEPAKQLHRPHARTMRSGDVNREELDGVLHELERAQEPADPDEDTESGE